jgi:hypothetical protein
MYQPSLKCLAFPTAFQADDEGSIPFTRSNLFSVLELSADVIVTTVLLLILLTVRMVLLTNTCVVRCTMVHICRAGGRVFRGISMFIRTVFIAVLSATIFIGQTAVGTARDAMRSTTAAKVDETAPQPTNRDPIAVNKVVTHHGAIVGAAADAHTRALLNEMGLPH